MLYIHTHAPENIAIYVRDVYLPSRPPRTLLCRMWSDQDFHKILARGCLWFGIVPEGQFEESTHHLTPEAADDEEYGIVLSGSGPAYERDYSAY